MSNVDKLLTKMRANFKDWRLSQLETIAKAFGVQVRKTGGSHVVFDHPSWIELLSVPSKRPIKPIYIKKFIALIDTLEVEND